MYRHSLVPIPHGAALLRSGTYSGRYGIRAKIKYLDRFQPKFQLLRNQSFHLHCKSKSWFLNNGSTRLKQINLVFNIVCIHNVLVINFLIFANNIIIQQTSEESSTIQHGFFANRFSCSSIRVYSVTFDNIHDCAWCWW